MRSETDLEKIAFEVDHWQRFNRYLVLEALEIVQNSSLKKALELGCGSGVTTSIYLSHFEAVTVVDGSATYLARARERNKESQNAEYICSYFEDLKLDYQFDDVIMAHILEHVEDPVGILQQATNWTTSNGKIHIIVPNGLSLHRRVGVELGMLSEPDELPDSEAERGHRRVYTLAKLEHDISQAGLKLTEARGCLVKVFPDAVLKVIHEEYIDALFRISRQVDPGICADLYVTCRK
ncbi:MAG: class I SAM-dependent methyltransferase [Thermodesulfobacteriota bacterium]|nr:class I SAM-dependent methyltransferase [Thermodesulfobacteriota bacterium]